MSIKNLSPLDAPPAATARFLALAFGASRCTLQFSDRSYSGLALVAHFPPASDVVTFAGLASKLAGGIPLEIRGRSDTVAAVFIPVSPFSKIIWTRACHRAAISTAPFSGHPAPIQKKLF